MHFAVDILQAVASEAFHLRHHIHIMIGQHRPVVGIQHRIEVLHKELSPLSVFEMFVSFLQCLGLPSCQQLPEILTAPYLCWPIGVCGINAHVSQPL